MNDIVSAAWGKSQGLPLSVGKLVLNCYKNLELSHVSQGVSKCYGAVDSSLRPPTVESSCTVGKFSHQRQRCWALLWIS